MQRAAGDDLAAAGHRLDGVGDQSAQAVGDLLEVELGLGQIRFKIEAAGDVVHFQVVAHAGEDPGDQLVDVPPVEGRMQRLRVAQHFLQYLFEAAGFADDRFDVAAFGVLRRRVLEQAAGEPADNRQGVADGVGDVRGDLADQGHLLHAHNQFLLLAQAVVGLGDLPQFLLQALVEGSALDGEGDGQGEGLQGLHVLGRDRPAVDDVVGEKQTDAAVLADQRHQQQFADAESFRLAALDPRFFPEVEDVSRPLLVEGGDEEMLGTAHGDREDLEQIAEFFLFRRHLLFPQNLSHVLQGIVVAFDLVPDAPGLFTVAGTDGDMSLEVLAILVDQQQNRPIQAEPLAGGNGGQRHGEDFVHGDRSLQDLADFMQKTDFPGAGLGLLGQPLHLGAQGQDFFDGVEKEGGQAVRVAIQASQLFEK